VLFECPRWKVGGHAVAAKVRRDHVIVVEVLLGEAPPPSTVACDAVQHQHRRPVLGAELVHVQHWTHPDMISSRLRTFIRSPGDRFLRHFLESSHPLV
jgi:hypothetical protein